MTEISRAFFQNLGQVRWLQLELRENQLTSLSEPTTTIYPGTSGSVFLTQLHMSGNPWKCDCTTGYKYIVTFYLNAIQNDKMT